MSVGTGEAATWWPAGLDPAGGGRPATATERAGYYANGWWSAATLSDRVRELATTTPDRAAYVVGDDTVVWADHDRTIDGLAAAFVAAGFAPGQRVAVILPDGALVHQVYVALERAGLVIVGLGARTGVREIGHLMVKTAAAAMVTLATHRDGPASALVAEVGAVCAASGAPPPVHVVVEPGGRSIAVGDRVVPATGQAPADRALGPDDLFLINSTSGTTGLPKCVTQHQNRWRYFHRVAVDAGALGADDVFMSVIPAPFGFGLWTAHFTPAYLGVPTVLMPRFDARGMIDAIERHRVTVLCCVSTQFVMLLDEQERGGGDVSSLRVMFTGGEAVPYARAAEFEETTGASVLQFYGSNETGLLSRTTGRDTRERRLRTAGAVDPVMQVRLYADDGSLVEGPGVAGQPACRGPAISYGYLDDPGANESLFTADGWMRIGDLATVDGDGYLAVVGRVSDIVIRGGKNISAVQVEDEVATHPDVAMVAVVPVPDPVFGERVCAFVVLTDEAAAAGRTVDVTLVAEHLAARGVGSELRPERIEVVAQLPLAPGGKVAKSELREEAVRLAASAANAR